MDFLPVIIHSLNLAIKKSIIVPPTPSGRSGFWQRKMEQQLPSSTGNQWLPHSELSNRLLLLSTESFISLSASKAALYIQTAESLLHLQDTHSPIPLNPDLTRRVRQRATQFHAYIQKGKECGDGSLLGELLDTKVSGSQVGNKCPWYTTDLCSSQSPWVNKGFNWTMHT